MIRRFAIDGAVAAVLAFVYVALYLRAFPPQAIHKAEDDWRGREPGPEVGEWVCPNCRRPMPMAEVTFSGVTWVDGEAIGV